MRTYTVERKAPYKGKLGKGQKWCDKCQDVHGAADLKKLEPWHQIFLSDVVPVPVRLSAGLGPGVDDFTMAADKDTATGVPEALALYAQDTGFFTAKLENPEDGGNP